MNFYPTKTLILENIFKKTMELKYDNAKLHNRMGFHY